MKELAFVPISIRCATVFVRDHHRHNPSVRGAKFAIGLEYGGRLVGVGMFGRPKARELGKDRFCGEAVRVCTSPDAPRGSESKIIARLKRIWQLHGGVRFVSYNREDESGASMRGAGLQPVAKVKGRQWACASRPRVSNDTTDKIRWEQRLRSVPA